MDSLQNILSQKNLSQPDELQALQAYVSSRYKSPAELKLQNNTIFLSVPSSALAATLQLEKQKIIEACGLAKKLVIRTGY